MRQSRQFYASFFFFYKQILNTQKRTKTLTSPKQTNKTKMSEQKATKATFFCAHNSKRIKVAYLRLVLFVLFVRVESFCKKKVNRLKIVLITSFPYTTSVYPPQPFIDNHFYAFIFICDYL